ncbi:hypothetical protein FGO68_gene10538 [Halteria grandinella]|uniref:Uncharacterized protein n=1 Tax=Halteria grandinella TaxID=5974 RepID=A0A8J8T4A9_HALGN|nr:hypothetical protein FGO68_gene10538 [Halteria grandinella]
MLGTGVSGTNPQKLSILSLQPFYFMTFCECCDNILNLLVNFVAFCSQKLGSILFHPINSKPFSSLLLFIRVE